MANRTGTYICFHAGGTSDPTASDIKYYRLLKAWHEHDDIDFRFVNSHDKAASVRDSSMRETLRRSLVTRLNASKNIVVIVGPTTKLDTDWVPFEIEYAASQCGIPFIVAYTGFNCVVDPGALRNLWPAALAYQIDTNGIRAIHIPFARAALDDAIRGFSPSNRPSTPLSYYTAEAHRQFGLL